MANRNFLGVFGPRFTRRTGIEIWVEIEVETDAEDFPVDGADQIEQAILDAGNGLGIGDDVIAFKIKSSVSGVPGLVDIVDFAIGTAASPTLESNIPIGVREKAVFASARVSVVVV